VGGIQAVTLGDEEARRRGTQKTVLERKAPPTFDILVEIQSWDQISVYADVASAVDALLRGEAPQPEVRTRDADGQIHLEAGGHPRRESAAQPAFSQRRGQRERGERTGPGRGGQRQASGTSGIPAQRIYPFGISRDRLERAITSMRVPATIVRDLGEATMVMTLKNYYRQGSQRLRQAEERGVPVYVLRNNTSVQIERQLADIFNVATFEDERSYSPRQIGHGGDDPLLDDAMLEAETAITKVLNGERSAVELLPRSSYVRRLQHQLAERYNVQSESRGREPNRRVKIFR
ncbi:MAG TPA: R3H domain-containing nucleic acid-binding protein, partial [Roseiflexaceae bacterium]|nr:R3H domain-containing nucleic acid-binding protein [Roseiflexaceae bacterium]